jgi:glutaredoxin
MHKVVTVVSKDGCHLCENVILALNSLSARYDLEVRVLDIKDDPKLREKYWLTVPAVQIGGKDVFDATHMRGEGGDAIMLERLLQTYDSTALSA